MKKILILLFVCLFSVIAVSACAGGNDDYFEPDISVSLSRSASPSTSPANGANGSENGAEGASGASGNVNSASASAQGGVSAGGDYDDSEEWFPV